MSPLEKSIHGFVGEAAVVRWVIVKFKKYLWGSSFTVLSYFSGLQKFFELEANIPHVAIRIVAVPIRNMAPTSKVDGRV